MADCCLVSSSGARVIRRASKVVWGAVLLAVLVVPAPAVAQRVVAADPATLGPIPAPKGCVGMPGAPRDVTFDVRGGSLPVASVAIEISATHTFVGDLDAELIAPSGLSATLFSHTGIGAGADPLWGANVHLDGTYTFSDTAAGDWDAAADVTHHDSPVIDSGAYRVPLAATFFGAPSAGRWTLRLTDRCETENGVVSAAVLRVTTLQTTRQ
jgi:Proprotein convertase P-domain